MFWECSLSFNIVQLPTPSSSSSSSSFSSSCPDTPFFLLSLSLSLSLRSGVSLSGSLLQRWVLQLSPAPGPEQEPRGPLGRGCLGQTVQKKPHLETKTHTAPFLLRFISFIWLLSLSLSCSLVSVFQNLYLFLSQPNCLVHLDLSGTDCSVDSVGVYVTFACSALRKKRFSD